MMERAVAIKKLGKLLGKTLGYRVDPDAPSQDEREVARENLRTMNFDLARVKAAMKTRCDALLAADAEYQGLLAEWRQTKQAASEAERTAMRYRFTVGTTSELFFHVKAQGDSWEDIFEILERKAAS